MAKRSVEETVEYLSKLADELEKRAARIENVADSVAPEAVACDAKAEAYKLAAFELERNTESSAEAANRIKLEDAMSDVDEYCACYGYSLPDGGAAAAAKWLTGGNMDANASYWANVERAVDLIKSGELR